MKPSRYNYMKKVGDYTHIYNFLSGQYLRLNAQDTVLSLMADNSNIAGGPVSNMLAQKGMLVNNDFNETDYVLNRQHDFLNSKEHLFLNIAPTMKCNLACKYCWERRGEAQLQDATGQAIVELVSAQISDLKSLTVTWLGGEPLLASETIFNLSRQLRDICQGNKVSFSANMISNGVLIDPYIVNGLKEVGLNMVHLTVDGMRDNHNEVKNLKGQGTFDLIMNNIVAIAGQVYLVLRINLTRRNYADATKLLELLADKGLKNYVHPYVAPIDENEKYHCSNEVIPSKEFADIYLDFKKSLFDYGWKEELIRKPKPSYCSVNSPGNLTINSNGFVCSCWEDLSMDMVPITLETCQKNPGAVKRYSLPLQEMECLECLFLPICMGGCAKRALKTGKLECCYEKYCFEELFDLYISDYDQARSSSEQADLAVLR